MFTSRGIGLISPIARALALTILSVLGNPGIAQDSGVETSPGESPLVAGVVEKESAVAKSTGDLDYYVQALASARATAEGLIAQGDYAGALDVLILSIRQVDPARAELADAVYSSGQMVSYVLLHLMPETEAYRYLDTGFDPVKYETDKMVKALCIMAIGLYGAEKDAQTAQVAYLTSSTNEVVRAISMFFLSNPYFFPNEEGFTGQYVEILSEEYPQLELTQVAMSFPLYAASQTGDVEALSKMTTESKSKSLKQVTWTGDLWGRVAASVGSSNTEKARLDGEFTPLVQGITDAADWRTRHFSLLLMKGALGKGYESRVIDATRQLADSRLNTPDVLQARIVLADALSANCIEYPEDEAILAEAVEVAEKALQSGVTGTTPERVMWETWAYGIQNCAKNLALAGHAKEAIALFNELSAKIPGSKIAAACDAAINELVQQQESPLVENAAE